MKYSIQKLKQTKFYNWLHKVKFNLKVYIYRRSIPLKVRNIRRKKRIKVLFLITDISKWKTELLYLEMLKHERFLPEIGISLRMGESPIETAKKALLVEEYLKSKKYSYIDLPWGIGDDFDIIIYQEPYTEAVPTLHNLYNNLNKLFISINYCCHTTIIRQSYLHTLFHYAWFDCFENETAASSAKKLTNGQRKNILVTGLPMNDALLDVDNTIDPWKIQNKRKKRIIWAPHHSIGNMTEAIYYGTFLENAEYILSLAEKYKDQVQWAFKPHPLLREKVQQVWGIKKTDEYFDKWESLENAQVSYGAYIDIFQYSDAMIHDSSSFIIEYLYMNKPVLFLNSNSSISEELSPFGKEAFSLLYKVTRKKDIEEFILNVLSNHDPLFKERMEFKNMKLLPPNNKTASENIIDAILGEGKYTNF